MTGYVFVSGAPTPQGSAKGFLAGGRVRITHDNPRTRPWRADVHATVRSAIGPGIVYPEGPVDLTIGFLMPRRKAEPKRTTPAHTRKPDGDKLERAILDALTGLIYTDDSQVVAVAWHKRTAELGEQPGVQIYWGQP